MQIKNKVPKVYLAAPIFSEADRDYNDKVANLIKDKFSNIDLYVPHHNKSINDKTRCASAEDIAKGDFTQNLDNDDIVIALVDGNAAPGIGTTVEIGYFARMCQEDINNYGYTNKKIIALYTDSRECSSTYLEAKNELLKEFAECQYSYLNLLLVGTIKRYGVMCRTIDDVLLELEKQLIILTKKCKDD